MKKIKCSVFKGSAYIIGNFCNASHLAWVYDIYCRTGVKIPFPIIADRNGEIARKYGMISSNISNTETVRNVYIINPNGVIKLILIYPLNIGRFIPEILRAVNALQIADSNKASTPANWVPCQPIINPAPTNVCEMEERLSYISQNGNGMNWYLSFKTPENCAEINSNNCQDNECEVKCFEDSVSNDENNNCADKD